MKRLFAFFLLGVFLLSITGCATEDVSSSVDEVQTIYAESSDTMETDQEKQFQETTSAPDYSGQILLTVSKLTFSVVGEQEDVYCGTLPREAITWTSADESIVWINNGIATAVGVGQTTVYAQYGDQKLECTVGCLAESRDALNSMSEMVLHSPRKYPPVGDGQPCSYFDDAVIIGDSVSYSLLLWAAETGGMGNATFLVRGGNSITGYVNYYNTISFQGAERTIEEAVALSGAKKAFIMMGVNDLGFMSVDQTVENLGIMIDRIREQSPEIEIYLESCLPVWDAGKQATKNVDVEAFNAALIAYAGENNFPYIEVASYVKDHTSGMAECYCSDFTSHMNYDGTDAWMQALKLFAQTQE